MAKMRPKKDLPITFMDKRGFWAAYILGVIGGGILYVLEGLDLLAAILIVTFLFVLIWISHESIRKDRENGNYTLFVATVMAAGGLILGTILLWLTSKNEKVFRYFVPIIVILELVLIAIGIWIGLLSGYTTYNLGPISNFSSSQAASLCNNNTDLAGSLAAIPVNYSIVSTYCSNSNVYISVKKN